MTAPPDPVPPRRRPRGAGAILGAWHRGQSLVTLVVVSVLASFAVGTVAIPAALGAETHAVADDAMSPVITPGSLVAVAPRAPSALRIGDVVAYHADEGDHVVTTRRVVRITAGVAGGELITHGAGARPSPQTVPADDVHGVVVYALPGLAYTVMAFGAATPIVLLALVGIVLVVYGSVLLVVDVIRARLYRPTEPIWDL